MNGKIADTARLFKDLGHPIRLKIVLFIAEEERCLCEILPSFNISQPTLSRHLSVLREHKIIKCRKIGNRILYTIADERVFTILKPLGFNFKARKPHSSFQKETKCRRIN